MCQKKKKIGKKHPNSSKQNGFKSKANSYMCIFVFVYF